MWQRFTERARKVVFYAQEEAQKFGEGYVSTEHLLLGLVREADSAGGQALDKLGVAHARVKAEVEKQLPRGEARVSQDMTLTPRAKRVIDLAYDEARLIGNNYIGTEHLLLGLVREGDGLAGRVLAKLGVELEKTRKVILEIQESQGHAADHTPSPSRYTAEPTTIFGTHWSGLTPLARRALSHAREMAVSAEVPVCAAHVVLAVLGVDCRASRAVSQIGGDPAQVRADILDHLLSNPPSTQALGNYSTECVQLVDRAVQTAAERRDEHIGTEHLLLGAVEQDIVGFAAHGIDSEALLAALKQL
ncbi:MAG: hypothetical protein JSS65_12105 [Armatimonadetes bacterium]|nr:hypothetical protein [Armatimonadota bacterium]